MPKTAQIVTDWPYTFDTAAKAVTWADTVLNIPDVGSVMEMIKRDRIQQSKLSRTVVQDVKDEAMTISVELAGVGHPSNDFYRYVYGINRKLGALAARLSRDCCETKDEGKRAQVTRLALLVLADKQLRERRGSKLKVDTMAERIGITRAQYYEQGWANLVIEMRERLCGYLLHADNHVTSRLVDLEIIN